MEARQPHGLGSSIAAHRAFVEDSKATFAKNTGLIGPSQVVIVDCFTGKGNMMDLDGDGVAETSHGDVVQQIIECTLPAAWVSRVDIADRPIGEALLEVLSKHQQSGGSVAQVNLSQQTFGTTVWGLANITNIPELRPDNLRLYKALVRERLKAIYEALAPEGNETLHWAYAKNWHTIDAIDKLTEAGVSVYVSAGNEGADQVNLFSLAQDVITVGSAIRDEAGRFNPLPYSARHALVDVYAQGDFMVQRDTSTGKLTFEQKLSARSSSQGIYLWGTSFATPAFLATERVRKLVELKVVGLSRLEKTA